MNTGKKKPPEHKIAALLYFVFFVLAAGWVLVTKGPRGDEIVMLALGLSCLLASI